MKKVLTAFYFLAAIFASAPASAAIVTLDYDITASQFFDFFGGVGAAPYDPVSFGYSLTFDNSADISGQSAGLTIRNLSFPTPFSADFSYDSASDFLFIGTNTEIGSFSAETDGDYGFMVGFASSSPQHFVFEYVSGSPYISANVGPGAPAPEVGVGLLSAVAAALALWLSRMPDGGLAFSRLRRRAAA
jgi:hypothetical protein